MVADHNFNSSVGFLLFLLVKICVALRWRFINHRVIIKARAKSGRSSNVYESALILLIECTGESILKVIRIQKSEVKRWSCKSFASALCRFPGWRSWPSGSSTARSSIGWGWRADRHREKLKKNVISSQQLRFRSSRCLVELTRQPQHQPVWRSLLFHQPRKVGRVKLFVQLFTANSFDFSFDNHDNNHRNAEWVAKSLNEESQQQLEQWSSRSN